MSAKPLKSINEICFWATGIGVVIVVLFWERQSLRSIGLHRLTMKEGLLSLWLGILLFILVPTLGILIERAFGIMTRTMVVVAALAKYPIWLRALLAARSLCCIAFYQTFAKRLCAYHVPKRVILRYFSLVKH